MSDLDLAQDVEDALVPVSHLHVTYVTKFMNPNGTFFRAAALACQASPDQAAYIPTRWSTPTLRRCPRCWAWARERSWLPEVL